MRRARNDEAGAALVFAVFGVAALGLVVASALLVGSSDIRASRNYRGASQIQAVNAVMILAFKKLKGRSNSFPERLRCCKKGRRPFALVLFMRHPGKRVDTVSQIKPVVCLQKRLQACLQERGGHCRLAEQGRQDPELA